VKEKMRRAGAEEMMVGGEREASFEGVSFRTFCLPRFYEKCKKF